MDISDILECKCCSDIFPEDISLAQPLYMALMLKYHPDKCSDPRAPEASAVINELYGKLKKAYTFQEKRFTSGSRALEIKYLIDIKQEYGVEIEDFEKAISDLRAELDRELASLREKIEACREKVR